MPHTPGPWEWTYDDENFAHVLRMGEAIKSPSSYETHLVWECEHSIDRDASDAEAKQFAECEANASLIAAAPDLLKVLKRFTYDGALMTFEDRERFRKAGRAAIAKAEGK